MKVTDAVFSLEGRNILVTGGTRGIGRAISLQFARAGAKVIANYVRGQKTADELAAQAELEKVPITLCRADLTSPAGVDRVDEAVATLDGPLHTVVHCAATGVHKAFEELTLRHYDWTFALNVRAFFELIKRLLPRFDSDASIVVLSSHGAVRAVPAYSLIGASKGALEAMARHMATELAPRGIRVNILAPGAVETDAWSALPDAQDRLTATALETPAGRLTTAEEVAHAAQFLCSAAGRSVVGHRLVIDGGAEIRIRA
jgi:enoyl-[acyl-carrier protein] reductase III